MSKQIGNSRINGVLFDLDGTLVDTAPDLVCALNLALKQYGYPTKSLDEVRDAASNGSLALVNAAQPHLNNDEKRLLQQALLHHYQTVNGEQAVFFDGIEPLLDYLKGQQIPCGIVTNKAACFARPLLQRLNLIHQMPAIVSGDSTKYSKPHPAPMLLAAQQIQRQPESIIYLGDAKRDLEAARNSNMLGAIAMWGYIGKNDDPNFWPQDFMLQHPLELISLLKNDI
ncbi:HAD-IA family hydrolase [Shewanella sp. Isolate11]|uniref:HAD family hydrolase n=1 Tax=Shewanella sp. Isolate11 TaxID=2908530 RepID=UPI001EFD0516|nr:HAD-IA family hydrolase [Shewanella sp. Isolate11]MCG9696710.1 HAD-IA family hydrolase [Shewanella sp. Isolate11]